MSTVETPTTSAAAPSAAPAPRTSGLPRLSGSRPDRPVPLSTLVRVEWRKQVDTRAGFWFMLTIGLVVAAVMVILFFVEKGNHSFADYFSATSLPLGILVPIVGILAATSEWSQRTGLTTFALEPRRGRVIAAKTLAAVVTALLAIVVALALGALVHGLAVGLRGADADWGITWGLVGGMTLLMALSVLQGLGFGLALLNTPAAIVGYLVLPTVWSIVVSLVSWMREPAKWLDIGQTTEPLLEGSMSAQQWGQLGTSALVWVALPLLVGTWRVLRTELK